MSNLYKQKINLYQKSQAFAPQLSALRIAQVWAGLSVVFILLAFAHKLNLNSQQRAIEKLKIEQAKESEQLIEVAQLKKIKIFTQVKANWLC